MSKLVAGNWKMFGNKAMIANIKKIDQYCKEKACEGAICPPFPIISAAREQTKHIKIGAQNCHININGAHTGEVSAEMLIEVGAQLMLWRRQNVIRMFHENDDVVETR